MTADMSVAPEIARLAGAVARVSAPLAAQLPAPPRTGIPHEPGAPHASSAGHAPRVADSQLTLGALARRLRMIAVAPERWWGLVRFNPDRSVKFMVEDQPEYQAWLVVLPPGDAGRDCDCDVATVIAGEATEGGPGSAVLRPGPTRVHGQRHRLRGHGAGYSISLHARGVPSASGNAGSGNPGPALSKSSAHNSSTRNVGVIGLTGHRGHFPRCAAREDSSG